MTTIRVQDVHFSYVAGEEVLRGVTLELRAGATAIIGENGAGKTTFVRLLNGLLRPTSGEVWVDDLRTADHTVAEMARKVGLVFQNPNDQIFKSNTLDEVMFGPRNLGVGEEEARARALAALERVGLGHAARRNPYDFGLADRKLIGIASVLAMDTEVVVLDEPTIGQDHRGVENIKGIVRDLADHGRLVVTITHDMDFVAEAFERTLVFRRGEVLADGPTREVFAQAELLAGAHLEPPHATVLGRAVGLARTVLTVDEFVADYAAGRFATGGGPALSGPGNPPSAEPSAEEGK